MANVILKSLTDGKRVDSLLAKDIPSYRKAYSDRTAWIMACLSELVYIKFNVDKNPKFVLDLDTMREIVDDKRLDLSQKISASIKHDNEIEKKNLEKELKSLDMELIKTFDDNGTQAILISCKKFIALVFRGTELTSIKDIKTDIKVKKTQCETGGGIHAGFNAAFDRVAIDIQTKINETEFKDKPLFITGHSLGGALATIAAKKLKHEGGIAACYTFGSPRVGDDEWISDIKTSVYRLVNSADCVTMLPGGVNMLLVCVIVLFGCVIMLLGCVTLLPGCVTMLPFHEWLMDTMFLPFRPIVLMLAFISIFLMVLGWWRRPTFGSYMHAGNMRYMTNCKSGQYKDVKLLYSVGLYYQIFPRRLAGWCKKGWPLTRFIIDHSISIYRKKLMVIAERRNQIT